MFSVRIDGFDGDHRRLYYYGRFDGSHWHVHPMAHAGRALYPAEEDYTGLAALDPSRPSHVVISTDADPVTGVPLVSRRDGRRHYELFEGETEDDGGTWCWTPLTEDSDHDNLRPVVPVWDADHAAVLWLRGNYTNYNRYDLDVVGLIRTSPSMSQTGRDDNESCAAPDVAAPQLGDQARDALARDQPVTGT